MKLSEHEFIELEQVSQVIQRYFDGLHYGDTKKLREIFHSDAYLKAPELRRSLDEWLALVAQRQKPATNGDEYAYRILSVDVVGQQAMVKVLCPLLGSIYIDFLGLLKEDGHWRIVNKMYADA
ncbi:nuclear transport factor 2 family protein [Photobacterium kasasachensis]|uniref:nuclear transport factor 2 family protein n=1 Tax=Photobacterium kasasachensis TaxID=2910240 RepID=UPI003D0FD59A